MTSLLKLVAQSWRTHIIISRKGFFFDHRILQRILRLNRRYSMNQIGSCYWRFCWFCFEKVILSVWLLLIFLKTQRIDVPFHSAFIWQIRLILPYLIVSCVNWLHNRRWRCSNWGLAIPWNVCKPLLVISWFRPFSFLGIEIFSQLLVWLYLNRMLVLFCFDIILRDGSFVHPGHPATAFHHLSTMHYFVRIIRHYLPCCCLDLLLSVEMPDNQLLVLLILMQLLLQLWRFTNRDPFLGHLHCFYHLFHLIRWNLFLMQMFEFSLELKELFLEARVRENNGSALASVLQRVKEAHTLNLHQVSYHDRGTARDTSITMK